MPIYEYEHRVTGERVELIRPVGKKYDCPPDLLPVISRPGRPKIGKGVPNPGDADQSVPRALKETEERIGTGALERASGFSHRQLKKAWDIK